MSEAEHLVHFDETAAYDELVFTALQAACNRTKRHPSVGGVCRQLGLPNTAEAERPVVGALHRLQRAGRARCWHGYEWHGYWEPIGLLERLARAAAE